MKIISEAEFKARCDYEVIALIQRNDFNQLVEFYNSHDDTLIYAKMNLESVNPIFIETDSYDLSTFDGVEDYLPVYQARCEIKQNFDFYY